MPLVQTVLLVAKTDRRPELRERIRRDYLHQPALALTLSQAARMWGLESSRAVNCSHLGRRRFPAVSGDARYHRAAK